MEGTLLLFSLVASIIHSSQMGVQVNGMLSVGDKLQDFPDYYRFPESEAV